MFLVFLIFCSFFGLYYYLSYQVILLNDLEQIFSQTASKAQQDLKEYSDLILKDLAKCHHHVLLLILAATFLTFIWILLLKYNAKVIIWVSLLSLPILLSVGLYFSTTTYINLRSKATNYAANRDFLWNDFNVVQSDDQVKTDQPVAGTRSKRFVNQNLIDKPGLQLYNNQRQVKGELEPSFAKLGSILSKEGQNFNPTTEITNTAGPIVQDQSFDKALQNILTAEVIAYIQNETLWLVISIFLFIILMILFIVLHSLRDRVRLSIALIRQASKAINGVKSTLLFPIIPRLFGIFALIWGILISLLIISASHPTYQIDAGPRMGLNCNPSTFNRANNNNITRTSQLASNRRTPPIQTIQFNGPTNDRRVPSNQDAQLRPNHTNDIDNVISGLQYVKKPECVQVQLLNRQHVWKYHALNLFATLWLIHFISGVSQTTLAGAFASYYWAYRKPQDVPFFAVTKSFLRVLKNHLGDIAFGSLLIATIRYIRIIIEFIDNRIRRKNSRGATDMTSRNVTCFLRVFFWLLDRFLKYIDRNAYILMSMYGEGYLKSAKRAVELLYKNSTRAIVLDYVTYFVLLVSRLLITILIGCITAQEVFTAHLNYKWLPIVLVVIGTHFIAKGLFSVYSMAVDTLFICFLIDSTQNDGSLEKPYFMAKDLRKILKRNTIMNRNA